MKDLIRRIVFIPMIIVCFPVLYFIAYCFDGHKKAMEIYKSIFKMIWEGG